MSEPARARDSGFAVIELVIVMIILSVLVLAVVLAATSAKVTSRNQAMRSAGANVDQAVGSFNRIYPPVGGIADPLVARTQFASTATTAPAGLVDETGARILRSWPTNPYTGQPVRVLRFAAASSCDSGAIGEIRVCRVPANGAQTYRITAWGRNRNGVAQLVYTARHGGR